MSDSKHSTAITRRRFLSDGGKAVAAAGVLTTSQSLTPPKNLRSRPQVLQAADFVYRGMFSVGSDVGSGSTLCRIGYSRANLAGRYVGSELRLFITGSRGDQWRSPLYEISPPPESSWIRTYETQAPGATFVRDWSRGNWGDTAPLYPNGQPVNDINGRTVKGLIYDPVLNGVWYSYLAVYNVAPTHDPSIGFIKLDDISNTATGYGPWRHERPSPQTGGYGLYIPDEWARVHFGGRNLAFGAETATRGVWGPNLFASERLADWASRPPDQITAQTSVPNGPSGAQPRWSIAGTPMVHHGLTTKMERASNYMNCGWQNGGQAAGYPLIGEPSWKNDYTFGPIAGSSQLTELDSMLSATFIDTGTKCGVVFFGTFVWPSAENPQPHTWYGPGRDVNGEIVAFCPHGQRMNGGVATPGYRAAARVPYWWIYDPLDMARVYKREVKPHEIAPKAAFSGQHMHGAANAPRFSQMSGWYVTGAWYDATAKRLYLAEEDGDWTRNREPRPMIHVFDIAA